MLSAVPPWQFRDWQWIALALAVPVVLAGLRSVRARPGTAEILTAAGAAAALAWSAWVLVDGGAGAPGLVQPAGAPVLALDAAAVLARDPSLVGLAAGGSAEGAARFGRAVGEARRSRQALEERGRAAVRAWNTLEQAHDLAAGRYEWEAARAATGGMEAFARALKQDAALDELLRERGGELGVAEGSRLARVAALDGAAVERELARELRLEQAPRQSPGMSMGM